MCVTKTDYNSIFEINIHSSDNYTMHNKSKTFFNTIISVNIIKYIPRDQIISVDQLMLICDG